MHPVSGVLRPAYMVAAAPRVGTVGTGPRSQVSGRMRKRRIESERALQGGNGTLLLGSQMVWGRKAISKEIKKTAGQLALLEQP